MKEGGLTYTQAVGAVGSLMGESGTNLKTNIRGTADNKGSNGIAQWHSERLSGLHAFAKKNNRKWTDLEIQARYIVHELKTTERAAYAKIKSAKSIEAATRAFTDAYERPNQDLAHHSRREQYARQLHGNVLSNRKYFESYKISNNPRMASLENQLPKNKNFDAKQKSMSKAEKDRFINEYKTKVRSLKGNPDALEKYHVDLYNQGLIGFDKNTKEITGFVGDYVRAQNKRNEPRTKADQDAKKLYLKAMGGLAKDSTSIFSANYRGIDKSVSARNGSIEVSVNDNAISKLAEATKQLAALDKKGIDTSAYRKNLSSILIGLQSPNKSTQASALKAINTEWTKITGKPVEAFKEKKLSNGQTVIVPGKDVTYNTSGTGGTAGFAFKTDAPELSLQDPKVITKNFSDLPVTIYNPQLYDGYKDNSLGDYVDDVGELPTDDTIDYGFDSIQYRDPTDHTPSTKNSIELAKLQREWAEKDYKTAQESKAAAEKARLQNEEDAKLADVDKVLGLEIPEAEEKPMIDPSRLKMDIPFTDIAKGAIGIALGKGMAEQELPLDETRINNSYLSMLHEHRRISEMGMNPTDEAEAKKSISEAYQMGVENIKNAAGGNRALILGNIANLDNINAGSMLKLSQMDQQAKDQAKAKYEEGLKYINDFEARRSSINETRKYQAALERRAVGTEIMAGGFKAMADALGSYDAPGSTAYMQKVKDQVELWGYSPLVKGDGWGSKAWAEEKTAKAESFRQNREWLNKQIESLPDEERKAFKKQYLDNPNAIWRGAEARFGTMDNPAGSGTVTVTEIDPVTQQMITKTANSEATVPMNPTYVKQSDGSLQPATPTGVTTTDNPSTTQSLINPEKIAAGPVAPMVKAPAAPVVQTAKTPDGTTVQIPKNQNGQKVDLSEIEKTAGVIGMGDTFDYAKNVNQMLGLMGEDEDERNKFARSLINKNAI